MQQRLTERWYRERAGPSLLQPLAALYGGVIALRRRAYATGWLRSGTAGKPVVVVGNLSVGGTGKTPFTIWLAQQLSSTGLKVGVVSRGYGRQNQALQAVDPQGDWREVGDEPLIISRHSGAAVAVGADRLAAARTLAVSVDVVLADDGLQHLALARDCEIILVDGARGFGNERLLPAGPLREPLTRLASADAVVVTGPPQHASLAHLPRGNVYRMNLALGEAVQLGSGARRALSAWRGSRVHAVAGIGNPARFFAELRGCGIEPLEHAFADHHVFSAAELDFADELPVLMTEKDAVKCTAFANPRLWYVPVSAQLAAEAARALLARVLARVRHTPAAGGEA